MDIAIALATPDHPSAMDTLRRVTDDLTEGGRGGSTTVGPHTGLAASSHQAVEGTEKAYDDGDVMRDMPSPLLLAPGVDR